ncbi:MAG: chloride channel protein [Prolixibacteraceae bacterium]|nr:chloride channel protein [Prolixibacteraceae bacterium]MBN2650596.1 chloride channel protein [Prolixibacteraceae bacterium]
MSNSLRHFNIWRVRRIPERTFILIVSALVGAVSGLAAVILKNLIHFSIELLNHNFLDKGTFLYLLFPIIGIAITLFFVKYFVKDDISHGVTKVLYSISKRNSFIKKHNTWTSMIASTITISFGGSVGAEAPVVYTGSAIGSNLARIFKLNYRQITLMVGCGAAGAIAGIFKAPLTGLLFTLEVLMLDLTMASLIPLMISAVTATTVAYFFMGDSVLLTFKLAQSFTIDNIGYYILLGIFCGLVSVYFTRATLYIEKYFKKIKNQLLRLLIGGSLLTLLIFMFPSVWGEGYNYISTILHGEGGSIFQNSLFSQVEPGSIVFVLLLFAILIFKVVAMAATNGAGGVGGIFAPTLVVGSFAGYFLVHTLNMFSSVNLPESNFALAGMSGVMAGVMHAPMTAIFLIAEITGGYDLILPLILVSTISYITIMIFEPHSIYTKRLAERGELLTHHKDKNVLVMLDTEKLIETGFIKLKDDETLRDFVRKVPLSKRNIFPVLDNEQKLVGVVLMENVRPIIFNRGLYDTTYVSDLMISPPAIVDMNENMDSVMKKFQKTKAWNLPVTENGQYRGFLSKSKIFNEYRDILIHFSDD